MPAAVARSEEDPDIADMMAEAARLDAYFQKRAPHLLYRLLRIRPIADSKAESASPPAEAEIKAGTDGDKNPRSR